MTEVMDLLALAVVGGVTAGFLLVVITLFYGRT